jgi:hypothetical protein
VVEEHVAFGVDRLHGPGHHGLDHRVAGAEVILHGGAVPVPARLVDVLDGDVVHAAFVHEQGGGVEQRLLP